MRDLRVARHNRVTAAAPRHVSGCRLMSSIKDPFVEIGAGKTVFREGEAATEMYIIESGQIELQMKSRGAATASVLGPGDFFGADFLLEGKARLSTAMVKENVRLLRLSRASLAEVIAENPEIALGLLRRVLEQQREGDLREQIAPPPVARSVASPVQNVALPVAAEAPRKPAPPVAEPEPVPAAPVVAAPQNFVLRHVASGDVLSLESGRNEFLVGRPDPATGTKPEIDLGPYDQNRSLSRRHARILKRDGVYSVREDSGTTNGTCVNGQRLETGVDVALRPGDKLRFGTIEVEFVAL